MCGLLGAFAIRNLDVVRMQDALRSIEHRGPDASGYYFDREVFLGHTRLSILDLTNAGSQPMLSPDKKIAVVFNGEIYNHKKLRILLESRGYLFSSNSDTEVLVHGYAEFGLDIIEKLDGMFAIAFYDQASSKIVLVRDRAGKKPLYYAFFESGIIFASEPKAILAAGLIEPEFEVKNLPFLMTYGYVPAPFTNYKNIFQIPVAGFLEFKSQLQIDIKKYWRVNFSLDSADKSSLNVESSLQALFSQAVGKRLEADVPVGAFLSGGIDSTLVVAMTKRLSSNTLKTFSAGFEGDLDFDERHYARYVADKYQTEHFETVVSARDIEILPKLVDIFDGPFGDSSMLPTYLVSKLAGEHVKVVLSGDGGDEVFCGYPRLIAGELAEYVPPQVRRLIRLCGAKTISPSGSPDFLSRFKRFIAIAALDLPQRMAAWSGENTDFVRASLEVSLRDTLNLEVTNDWVIEYFGALKQKSVLGKILNYNFETYLPFDLMVKIDRASMATGLEVRCPFLDVDLIEFVSSINGKYFHRGFDSKWILKKSFKDMLPPKIANRKKMGFGMPLARWFRHDLKSYVMENLGDRSCKIYDYLDFTFVRQCLESHMSNERDHGARIWLWLTLQIWLKNLK